jgi:glycosyltransferase involved in cell wall biosynthesis
MTDTVELTIVMPCLNEAETLPACIQKAQRGLESERITGEVVIADNGSTDGSIEIAQSKGARVVRVPAKGYGSALRGGIAAARGKWIIMGDADDSYDFQEIGRFVEKLREGNEFVMGCRLPSGGGTIMPGAMPWKNRWIGTPALSLIGRVLFNCPTQDFNCGLRGFSKEAFDAMEVQTTGMEFASELIIKSTLRKLRIAEVPITLHKDGRSRPPHLRPWRDGWRHLRFMLLFSPRWLFLIPGLILALIGVLGTAALMDTDIRIGSVLFNVGTLAMACMSLIVGFQLITFAFFTKVFAIAEGLLPDDPRLSRVFRKVTLEKGVIAGSALLLAGFAILVRALWIWRGANYGILSSAEDNLRQIIPASTLIVLGIQTVFSSFFISALGLKTSSRRPPAADN